MSKSSDDKKLNCPHCGVASEVGDPYVLSLYKDIALRGHEIAKLSQRLGTARWRNRMLKDRLLIGQGDIVHLTELVTTKERHIRTMLDQLEKQLLTITHGRSVIESQRAVIIELQSEMAITKLVNPDHPPNCTCESCNTLDVTRGETFNRGDL